MLRWHLFLGTSFQNNHIIGYHCFLLKISRMNNPSLDKTIGYFKQTLYTFTSGNNNFSYNLLS